MSTDYDLLLALGFGVVTYLLGTCGILEKAMTTPLASPHDTLLELGARFEAEQVARDELERARQAVRLAEANAALLNRDTEEARQTHYAAVEATYPKTPG